MPRMPHNNRLSTSASLKTHDIWKSTIGHDPYADTTEENEKTEKAKLDQEKAKTLLKLARSQNIEGSSNRNGASGMMDDYAKKMFFGLKGGKKRRADLMDGDMNGGLGGKLSEDARRRLEEDSSSEDEFVEEDIDDEEVGKEMMKEEDRKINADQEEKSKKKKKKRKSRKKYSSSSSSSSDSDDSSSYHRSKKRRKKDERKKKSRKKDKGDEDRKKKKHKH